MIWRSDLMGRRSFDDGYFHLTKKVAYTLKKFSHVKKNEFIHHTKQDQT